jgi:hypothetical protein
VRPSQATSNRWIATDFFDRVFDLGRRHKKTALEGAVSFDMRCSSALASFEPTLRFVDHINAAFATHNTAITVPVLERAERVLDLHGLSPVLRRLVQGVASAWCYGCPGNPKQ